MPTDHPTTLEVWRPVLEAAGYEVSNLGRVRSFRNGRKGSILSPRPNIKNGYVEIGMESPNGRRGCFYVHRLVASAFLGQISTGQVVNHKNKCRTDNAVDNLEILSHGQNVTHRNLFEWIRAAVRMEIAEPGEGISQVTAWMTAILAREGRVMANRFPPYPKNPHVSGHARISIKGKSYYLGPFGSPESRAEYRRLMVEWEAGTIQAAKPGTATVAELQAAYMLHVAGRYSAKQVDRIGRAMSVVLEIYGRTSADAFRLSALETVRAEMLRGDWSRCYVNAMVGCIKKAWKWAGQRRMVTAECVADLGLLENLRQGQLGARELPAVSPVEWEDVRKVLRYLRPQTRAMALLQWFAGMRTQEVLLMRSSDIDCRKAVWLYRPHQHKNKWRGQDRTVYLGPVCQRILRRYLAGRAPDVYLFSPREAMAGKPGGGRQELRDRYTNETYARAVARACRAAGVRWNPYQLRHAAATRVAEEYDPETARLVLGQRSLTATRRYVVDRGGKAAEAMRKIG